MKKKGITVFFVLMMATLFFFLGLALSNPINEVTQESRTNADCTNSSIDSFQKGGCIILDLYSPYLIGFIFALGGAFIGYIIP